MLKGYIDCTDTKKLLLKYVNFNLNKKDMQKIAQHLRICPNCTNEYSKIISRKRMLKQKMKVIEAKLRMETEISSYLDEEINEKTKKSVENMIETNIYYKNEISELKKTLNLIHKVQDDENKKIKFNNTNKIISRLRLKKIQTIKLKKAIAQLFQFLRHGFLKFQ